jgi:hypothetical protein
MRSWRWYIKFPLDAYALGPIHFSSRDYPKGADENDARQFARKWEKVKRLPAGFSCWPAK